MILHDASFPAVFTRGFVDVSNLRNFGGKTINPPPSDATASIMQNQSGISFESKNKQECLLFNNKTNCIILFCVNERGSFRSQDSKKIRVQVRSVKSKRKEIKKIKSPHSCQSFCLQDFQKQTL